MSQLLSIDGHELAMNPYTIQKAVKIEDRFFIPYGHSLTIALFAVLPSTTDDRLVGYFIRKYEHAFEALQFAEREAAKDRGKRGQAVDCIVSWINGGYAVDTGKPIDDRAGAIIEHGELMGILSKQHEVDEDSIRSGLQFMKNMAIEHRQRWGT